MPVTAPRKYVEGSKFWPLGLKQPLRSDYKAAER